MTDAIPDVVVDARNALTELVGSDDALHARLMRHFVEDLPLRLNRISQALGKRDIQVAAQQAHSLKSAARAMGAETLAGLCRQIEDAHKQNDPAAAMRALPALQAESERVKGGLEWWLGRPTNPGQGTNTTSRLGR